MSIVIAILLGLYVLSPIDLLPEVILGPFGLIDDLLGVIGIIGALLCGSSKNKKEEIKIPKKKFSEKKKFSDLNAHEKGKRVAEVGIKKVGNRLKELEVFQGEICGLENEELVKLFKKSSFDKQLLIDSVVRERGYYFDGKQLKKKGGEV